MIIHHLHDLVDYPLRGFHSTTINHLALDLCSTVFRFNQNERSLSVSFQQTNFKSKPWTPNQIKSRQLCQLGHAGVDARDGFRLLLQSLAQTWLAERRRPQAGHWPDTEAEDAARHQEPHQVVDDHNEHQQAEHHPNDGSCDHTSLDGHCWWRERKGKEECWIQRKTLQS